MANIHRGTGNMHLQRGTVSYGPQTGYINEFEYRGFSYAAAVSLANAWANTGAQYSLTNQMGVATLVIQDSSGSYVLDTWEIGVTQVVINSFFNPRNVNKLFDLSSRNKSRFLEGVQNKDRWDSVYERMTDTANEAVLKRAYDRFLDGGDSYYDDQYVVRHTTNVSTRYPYNIADTNKNSIYSPARFYTEVQSAALWLYPMPASFVNVLTSNLAPTVPTPLTNYYRWGYLKGGSPRVTAANNRTNIYTEYKQALWSTDEYDSVT